MERINFVWYKSKMDHLDELDSHEGARLKEGGSFAVSGKETVHTSDGSKTRTETSAGCQCEAHREMAVVDHRNKFTLNPEKGPLTSQCHLCMTGFTMSTQPRKNPHIHMINGRYACNVCGNLFAKRSDHLNHIKLHSLNDGEKHEKRPDEENLGANTWLVEFSKPNVEPAIIDSLMAKLEQTNQYRNESVVDYAPDSQGQVVKDYECTFCHGYSSNSEQCWTKHERQHQELRQIYCPECIIVRRHDIRESADNIHDRRSRMSCKRSITDRDKQIGRAHV